MAVAPRLPQRRCRRSASTARVRSRATGARTVLFDPRPSPASARVLDVVSGQVGTAADDLGHALRILHKGGMLSSVGVVFRIGAAHCSLAGDAKGAAFLRATADGRRTRTVTGLTAQEWRDLDASATVDLTLAADEVSLTGRSASLSEAMARFRTLLSEPPDREGITW